MAQGHLQVSLVIAQHRICLEMNELFIETIVAVVEHKCIDAASLSVEHIQVEIHSLVQERILFVGLKQGIQAWVLILHFEFFYCEALLWINAIDEMNLLFVHQLQHLYFAIQVSKIMNGRKGIWQVRQELQNHLGKTTNGFSATSKMQDLKPTKESQDTI